LNAINKKHIIQKKEKKKRKGKMCNILLRVHNIGRKNEYKEQKKSAYVLQRSMKFTKTVFFVPSRRTCGGLITVLRLSPASSGLFSLRMLNTLPRSCRKKNHYKPHMIIRNMDSTSSAS